MNFSISTTCHCHVFFLLLCVFEHGRYIWNTCNKRVKIPWLKKIIWVIGVLRRTVAFVSDWRFDNLCRSHLKSQVIVLVENSKTMASDLIAHQDFWIFNWLKTITWLLRWLPHRLSKRHSLTTVLLRTPITQMIFFNQGMLLLGSNHFLRVKMVVKFEVSDVASSEILIGFHLGSDLIDWVD